MASLLLSSASAVVERLSIIVPAHNNETTIRAALESAEESAAYLRGRPGHRGAVAEVVVVDDGSRDGTMAAILDACREKELFRVFHRRSGSSPACARNQGVALSTGSVLLFLDADDVFLERHLFECCRMLEDPSIDLVKTGVALSDPVHPDWPARIANSLTLNLAVRSHCHDFVGGFPDYHLFRRVGDSFVPLHDLFRRIEDVHYNSLLTQFFRRGSVTAETVRYLRHAGNSFDRQYAKFQQPVGSYRDDSDDDFELRVRLSKVIVDHHAKQLARKLVNSEREESRPPS